MGGAQRRPGARQTRARSRGGLHLQKVSAAGEVMFGPPQVRREGGFYYALQEESGKVNIKVDI